MIRKNHSILFMIVLITMLFVSSVTAQEKLKVFTSIAPQSFIVRQIAGDEVDVKVLIKLGQEPHTFEVTPRQLISLSKARVLFVIGFPFEKSLTAKLKGTYRKLIIVDVAKGVKKRMMTEHHDHQGEDHHDDHEGEEADPHTWLSPAALNIQAKNICKALVSLKPESKKRFEANLDKFIIRSGEVERKIKAALAKYKGREFLVFHPSFGYFADHFGLKQIAIEAGGKKPSARQLAEVIKEARRSGIKIIIAQPQFDKRSAEVVARSIGGRVVFIDHLRENVFTTMLDISSRLEIGFASR